MKSTVAEIRARFDRDVERFSNLETGQTAAIDGPLALDLVTEAAAAVTPGGRAVLDVGCGAGNFTLKLLQRLAGSAVTLVDLSLPMLERAKERITAAGGGPITLLQGDIRELELGSETHDIILAAAVLHHLRTPEEWRSVCAKFHRTLGPGGSLWVYDLVEGGLPAIREQMRRRYGAYLEALQGPAYRDHVFAYMDREDTPQTVVFQLDMLREVGFAHVELLHMNACFAAFGAVKTP